MRNYVRNWKSKLDVMSIRGEDIGILTYFSNRSAGSLYQCVIQEVLSGISSSILLDKEEDGVYGVVTRDQLEKAIRIDIVSLVKHETKD